MLSDDYSSGREKCLSLGNGGTQRLRYQLYLKSRHTFWADEMYIEPM